jgi:hypothetical protein
MNLYAKLIDIAGGYIKGDDPDFVAAKADADLAWGKLRLDVKEKSNKYPAILRKLCQWSEYWWAFPVVELLRIIFKRKVAQWSNYDPLKDYSDDDEDEEFEDFMKWKRTRRYGN